MDYKGATIVAFNNLGEKVLNITYYEYFANARLDFTIKLFILFQ